MLVGACTSVAVVNCIIAETDLYQRLDKIYDRCCSVLSEFESFDYNLGGCLALRRSHAVSVTMLCHSVWTVLENIRRSHANRMQTVYKQD